MRATNGYHRTLCRWISQLGVLYTEEYQVGAHSIDIFLPEMDLFVEVDGPFLNHTAKANRQREETILTLEPEKRFVRIKVGTPKPDAMEAIFGVL